MTGRCRRNCKLQFALDALKIGHKENSEIKRGDEVPKLNIRLNSRSGDTKTEQVYSQISSAITGGKFSPGDALPSERELAEHLGTSRKVVRNAYRRLSDQGMIETLSTSGRRVRGAGKGRAAGAAGGGAGKGAASKGAAKSGAGAAGASKKSSAKGAAGSKAGAKKGRGAK